MNINTVKRKAVVSILAGDGGNTVDTVAERLALLGHAQGRYLAAAWIVSAIEAGDMLAALNRLGDYAHDVIAANERLERERFRGWYDAAPDVNSADVKITD